jgi:hypothetical protein
MLTKPVGPMGCQRSAVTALAYAPRAAEMRISRIAAILSTGIPEVGNPRERVSHSRRSLGSPSRISVALGRCPCAVCDARSMATARSPGRGSARAVRSMREGRTVVREEVMGSSSV